MENKYIELMAMLKEGETTGLVTILPEPNGDLADVERLIVTEETTGDRYEEMWAMATMKGAPVLAKLEDKTLILEPFCPEERLIILGGGHIALPLVEFGAKLGFSVTVIDDRYEFANPGRFPLAKQVICKSFENCFEGMGINEHDYVIVVTRGHRYDGLCLRQLLKMKETVYLGMIGSRHRVRLLLDSLREEGYDSGRIDRICSPIGLRIGGVTPEEIAISILAEVIQRKRLDGTAIKQNKIKMANHSDIDFDVLEALAEEKGVRKSIITIISAKGSVPRGAGAKMIVYEDGRSTGSIGGGCSEGAVMQEARDLIGTGEYVTRFIDMTGQSAEDEGMVCGGVMTVLIEDASDY